MREVRRAPARLGDPETGRRRRDLGLGCVRRVRRSQTGGEVVVEGVVQADDGGAEPAGPAGAAVVRCAGDLPRGPITRFSTRRRPDCQAVACTAGAVSLPFTSADRRVVEPPGPEQELVLGASQTAGASPECLRRLRRATISQMRAPRTTSPATTASHVVFEELLPEVFTVVVAPGAALVPGAGAVVVAAVGAAVVPGRPRWSPEAPRWWWARPRPWW